jgi:hypothetical protein
LAQQVLREQVQQATLAELLAVTLYLTQLLQTVAAAVVKDLQAHRVLAVGLAAAGEVHQAGQALQLKEILAALLAMDLLVVLLHLEDQGMRLEVAVLGR